MAHDGAAILYSDSHCIFYPQAAILFIVNYPFSLVNNFFLQEFAKSSFPPVNRFRQEMGK